MRLVVADDIQRLKDLCRRERASRQKAEKDLESMSMELYQVQTELKSLNQNFEEKVEQRTKKLAAARDEAINLAEVKADFLANMSHELRTPLNGVLGMMTLLKNTDLDNRQVKLVSTAVNSGELLLALINDVLDLSKLENDKFELESISFDPSELIRFTCEPFITQAAEKKLDLVYMIAPDLPLLVKGDPTRIKQILTNLVSNAMKFTERGEILITAYFDEELVVSVSDTGIGMTASQVDKVLDKFSQANESTSRKFGGTGLGLSICQKLVEAMEGMLSISSEFGVGSRFEMRIPCAIVQGEMEFFYGTDLSDKRVLVGFNNLHMLHYTETLLQFWNISHIDQAHNFNRIMELCLSDKKFDIIIVDQRMPSEYRGDIFEFITEKQPQARLISYWLSGAEPKDTDQHIKLSLPVNQSDLFDSLVQTPDSEKAGKRLLDPDKVMELRFYNSRILLAEDNKVNQEVAKGLLSHFGCEVWVANNGQEAIDLVSIQEFDLILMDIQMPVVDGFEAVKSIRAMASAVAKLPIVALTAHNLQGDREKSIDAGMDEHLTKPIEVKQLANILNQFLMASEKTETPQTLDTKMPKVKTLKVEDNSTFKNAVAADNDMASMPDSQSTKLDEPPQSALAGLDTESALARVLNNLPLYINVLAEFKLATADNQAGIQQAITSSDLQSLQSLTHTIKGSSANIGGFKVQKTAAEFEEYTKSVDHFESLDNRQLDEYVNQLQIQVDELFNSIDEFVLSEQPKEQTPLLVLSNEEILSLCNNIKSCLYTDLSDVDGFISQLESAKLDEDLSNAVSSIRQGYQNFEFDLIEAQCDLIEGELL